MALIYEDTRQQTHHGDKHAAKHAWWAEHGVEIERRKLDTGDYMTDGSNVTVDTKRGIDELAQNINGRNHERFKNECVRARDNGLLLVVLVECTQGYGNATDVAAWTNGHCLACSYRHKRACNPRDAHGKCPRHGTRKPIQGPRLSKALFTMSKRYKVRFEFCHPRDAARRVCELLGVEYEQDES